jgi:hypothetical protein
LKDPASKLLSGNTNAKSDVANKLISMFLHELSRSVSRSCAIKVKGKEYVQMVRESFNNQCPYCSRELTWENSIVEHLDGMNRLRAGLHVPGNVLVACKECNNRKRTDDSRPASSLLARSGWESFLSHDGTSCGSKCMTCEYWARIWPDDSLRKTKLADNLTQIKSFRNRFTEISYDLSSLMATLPSRLIDLYSDCQIFARTEIDSLLVEVHKNIAFSQGHAQSPNTIEALSQQAREEAPSYVRQTTIRR